jgi:hypothetical protein
MLELEADDARYCIIGEVDYIVVNLDVVRASLDVAPSVPVALEADALIAQIDLLVSRFAGQNLFKVVQVRLFAGVENPVNLIDPTSIGCEISLGTVSISGADEVELRTCLQITPQHLDPISPTEKHKANNLDIFRLDIFLVREADGEAVAGSSYGECQLSGVVKPWQCLVCREDHDQGDDEKPQPSWTTEDVPEPHHSHSGPQRDKKLYAIMKSVCDKSVSRKHVLSPRCLSILLPYT